MKKGNRKIVLIDDDSTTNFLNKMIIEKANLVDEIIVFDEPEKALAYFKENKSKQSALILLDINMPVMNGWEFLELYAQIQNGSTSDHIVMLTSSIDPEDKQRAEEFKNVSGYRSKPLSIDMLEKLVERYLN
jgi:CheY-like chemotaxis protein